MNTIACKIDTIPYLCLSQGDNDCIHFNDQTDYTNYSYRLRSMSDKKLIAVWQAFNSTYEDEPGSFCNAIQFELHRRGLVGYENENVTPDPAPRSIKK